ncbi:MAG: hypothetical protein Fur006_46460 [Coleofasciculaceae cyanobacterium]
MSKNLLAILSAIVLFTGLSLSIAQAQTPQLVSTLAFNQFSLNQSRESAPSPIRDRGAPRDRKGGASHAT